MSKREAVKVQPPAGKNPGALGISTKDREGGGPGYRKDRGKRRRRKIREKKKQE